MLADGSAEIWESQEQHDRWFEANVAPNIPGLSRRSSNSTVFTRPEAVTAAPAGADLLSVVLRGGRFDHEPPAAACRKLRGVRQRAAANCTAGGCRGTALPGDRRFLTPPFSTSLSFASSCGRFGELCCPQLPIGDSGAGVRVAHRIPSARVRSVVVLWCGRLARLGGFLSASPPGLLEAGSCDPHEIL